jgi:hypothetical protein
MYCTVLSVTCEYETVPIRCDSSEAQHARPRRGSFVGLDQRGPDRHRLGDRANIDPSGMVLRKTRIDDYIIQRFPVE